MEEEYLHAQGHLEIEVVQALRAVDVFGYVFTLFRLAQVTVFDGTPGAPMKFYMKRFRNVLCLKKALVKECGAAPKTNPNLSSFTTSNIEKRREIIEEFSNAVLIDGSFKNSKAVLDFLGDNYKENSDLSNDLSSISYSACLSGIPLLSDTPCFDFLTSLIFMNTACFVFFFVFHVLTCDQVKINSAKIESRRGDSPNLTCFCVARYHQGQRSTESKTGPEPSWRKVSRYAVCACVCACVR